jgi:hypothetical protein
MADREHVPADRALTPTTARLIDDYFARFRIEALALGARGLEDSVADLQDHILARLDGAAGLPADAVRVLGELGPPEVLAAAYVDASVEPDRRGPGRGCGSRMLTGSLLGVPFDLRPPSSQRSASRWWNPLDRRILVPKALGMGWTVNFGALAVLTRLVRPDDEDIPFASVPPRIVAGTLLVPLVALGAFAVLAATSWSQLPARVPTHWGVSGEADSYAGRGSALLFLSLMAAAPVAVAGWVHLRRRQPLNRVGASALSLSLTVLALAALAQTLFTVRGGVGVWPILAGLFCSLALPFGLLVGLSRIGRDAEQRRDLSDGFQRKGVHDER